jgi:hypothetical protein
MAPDLPATTIQDNLNRNLQLWKRLHGLPEMVQVTICGYQWGKEPENNRNQVFDVILLLASWMDIDGLPMLVRLPAHYPMEDDQIKS